MWSKYYVIPKRVSTKKYQPPALHPPQLPLPSRARRSSRARGVTQLSARAELPSYPRARVLVLVRVCAPPSWADPSLTDAGDRMAGRSPRRAPLVEAAGALLSTPLFWPAMPPCLSQMAFRVGLTAAVLRSQAFTWERSSVSSRLNSPPPHPPLCHHLSLSATTITLENW